MTREESEVAVDTVTAILRQMALTADAIAVALRVAVEIQAGDEEQEWKDRGTALLIRTGGRLAADLAELFRRFPVLP